MSVLAAWRDAFLAPADLGGLGERGRLLARISVAALGVAISLFAWRLALWLPPVDSNSGFNTVMPPIIAQKIAFDANLTVDSRQSDVGLSVFGLLNLLFAISNLLGPLVAAVCLFKGWRLRLGGTLLFMLILHLGANTMRAHLGEANVSPKDAARMLADARPADAAERSVIAVVAAELAYVQADAPGVARHLRAIGPALPRTTGTEWRIGVMQDWAQAHGQTVTRFQPSWLLVMPTGEKRAMRIFALSLGVGALMVAVGCAGLSVQIRRRVTRLQRRFPDGEVALA